MWFVIIVITYVAVKFEKWKVIVVENFPTPNDDAPRLFNIIERNVNILTNNWERLVEFSKRETGEKTQQVISYASDDWIAELNSIREKLGTSEKTIKAYLDLSDEFSEIYIQFVRLLFWCDFDNFTCEECEEFEEV